jgi:hypothetical protein
MMGRQPESSSRLSVQQRTFSTAGNSTGKIFWEKGRVEVNFTSLAFWNDFICIGYGEDGERLDFICQLW